jgi:UDP-glucose 4-epimerase
MKVIVTGGAGFIGSNLVDELVKLKYKVTVIDNFVTGLQKNLNQSKKNIKIEKIDISKCPQSKLEKIFKNTSIVFHLAGLADIVPSITNPQSYFDTNVNGTFKVLLASKNCNVKKFIYAASASCYGIPENYPTKESSKFQVEYPYALTKLMGEELTLHWAKVYGMHNISCRFFNVYGQRSRTTGAYGAVFGVFLAQKLANKPLTIVGNGKQTRDFIHVSDLVNALVKASKNGKKGTAYNLGSGKETSVNTIAKLIGGKKIFIPKRPGEPDRSLANISKAKKDFRWKPKTSIKNGVESLLKNIKDWEKAPLWTTKKIKKATKTWFKYLG